MQIQLPEKVAELLAKPLTIKGRKRIREAKEAHARKVKRHKNHLKEGNLPKKTKDALKELEDYVDKKNSSYDEETKKIDSYGLGKRILKKTGRALKTHFEFDKDLFKKMDNVFQADDVSEDVEGPSTSEMQRILKKQKGTFHV